IRDTQAWHGGAQPLVEAQKFLLGRHTRGRTQPHPELRQRWEELGGQRELNALILSQGTNSPRRRYAALEQSNELCATTCKPYNLTHAAKLAGIASPTNALPSPF